MLVFEPQAPDEMRGAQHTRQEIPVAAFGDLRIFHGVDALTEMAKSVWLELAVNQWGVARKGMDAADAFRAAVVPTELPPFPSPL